MRFLAFCAFVALLVVGFLAFDPSYQAQRADNARFQAQLHALQVEREDLVLRERVALSPVVVASDGALRVGALLVGALVVLIALDMYRQRRRPLVRPDARGLLPVARDELLASPVLSGELARLHHEVAALRAVYQVPAPAHLNYAPRFEGGACEPGEAEQVENAITLPSAPSWAALVASGFVPTAERVLLGYSSAGPVYGPVSGLLSTAIAGRPGQGKSTLLRFIYAQVASLGGQSVVWDLHGSIADDVAGADICEDVEEIERSARRLLQELEKRHASRQVAKPMLVLVDEWPALSLASKPARQAVAKIVLEGRKFGIYALIAGQGLPADHFGGSLVRDALSSRYVFRTSAAQGRMAGLEKEHASLLAALRPGFAVLAGPVEPQIVAIPQTTMADVAGLVVKPAGKTKSSRSSTKPVQSSLFDGGL